MSNVKISKDKAINVVSFLWEIDNSSVAMKDNDIKYGKVINSDTINMIDVKNSYLYMEKILFQGLVEMVLKLIQIPKWTL